MKKLYRISMILLFGLLVASPAVGPVHAQQAVSCFTPAQMRAAISENKALALGVALRKNGGFSEVLTVRLCKVSSGKLVYFVTALNGSGKVAKLTLLAKDGNKFVGN